MQRTAETNTRGSLTRTYDSLGTAGELFRPSFAYYGGQAERAGLRYNLQLCTI